MINICLCGYGKMGRQIEAVLANKGISVKSRIDKYNDHADFKEINSESLKNIEVVIDFSSPDSVISNIEKYVEHNVNVVMGTTGWYDKLDLVKRMVGDKIGFIWSGNFSLGVNLFFKIIQYASQIVSRFKEYDVMVHEFHHREKKDSPSGTALMIGDIIKNNFDGKEKIVTERLDRKIEENEVHISSTRGGYIPGTHSVIFDSPVDSIELKHIARNREGFAFGAVTAALWIKDKKGFYNFEDMFKI